MQEQLASESAPRPLFPVAQFCERHSAWTEQSIRALIYASQDRFASNGRIVKGNGLEAAGAIVRVGRRVLIDEQAFFRWIANLQRVAARGDAPRRRVAA